MDSTHRDGRFTARILRRMAISTDGIIADAEHRITGFQYLMIAVAGGAPRNSHLDKELSMPALVKELGIDGVTLAADIPHPRDAGRRGAVIAVTVIAGGRRQVSFTRHYLPMNTFLVVRELVGGNLVGRHIFGIGMT